MAGQVTRREKTIGITALGGGTGLSVVLQGLRPYCAGQDSPARDPVVRLSAIVNVADDGGSSGALRRALKIQPPGDVRNCLMALSRADPTLQALFDFRFDAKIDEHSLGNLMLTALTVLEKDFTKAIKRACNLLAVQGQVIPATTEQVDLLAQMDDGKYVKGETRIRDDRRRIRRISLLPADAETSPEAIAALAASDLIVIGPGSLYSSLLPNLLLGGVNRAIVASQAPVVLVMNLMTEPGETDGYSAADTVAALHDHVPDLSIHSVLLNTTPLSQAAIRRYAAFGSEPVVTDTAAIAAMGCTPVSCDLLARGARVRHDSARLAKALMAQVANVGRSQSRVDAESLMPGVTVTDGAGSMQPRSRKQPRCAAS